MFAAISPAQRRALRMVDTTSLPPFSEILTEHGVKPKALLEAVEQYVNLSHELLLEQDPHSAPFDFLAVSDQHDMLQAFLRFLYAQ